MSYDIQGKVIHVGDTEKVGQKGFRKRILVIETDEKWPQQVPIEFCQDDVDRLDNLACGLEVEVEFAINGREWEGRYFVNLRGWKVRKIGTHVETRRAPREVPPPEEDVATYDEGDEIPF
ncbi:MAG: DUF3127 domain-containing protein [Ilumatobacteraceae bacterium]